ncbi:hypothetical protein D3C80_1663330 [compost metagenome]
MHGLAVIGADSDRPRAIGSVRERLDAEVAGLAAGVDQVDIDVAIGNVVADADLRCDTGVADAVGIAAEMAVEAVGAQYPQVVLPGVVLEHVPGVAQGLAGFHDIAARNAAQLVAVVDVEHRGLRAGVGEYQFDLPHGAAARAGVQLVGQRA